MADPVSSVAYSIEAALRAGLVLTIAISSAAGASAVITFFSALAPWQIPFALLLVAVVTADTRFGHIGRTVFALMTVVFIAVALTPPKRPPRPSRPHRRRGHRLAQTRPSRRLP